MVDSLFGILSKICVDYGSFLKFLVLILGISLIQWIRGRWPSRKTSYLNVKIAWLCFFISQFFYLFVLIWVSTQSLDGDGSLLPGLAGFSMEAILSWKGYGSLGSETTLILGASFGFLSLLITTGVILFGGKLMEGPKNSEQFTANMLIGISIAEAPAIIGLIFTLLHGKILFATGFFALAMVGKIRFYPGFYHFPQDP